jgi:hypothetical protein
VGAMLFPNSAKPSTLLPPLSLSLIHDCNNFEGECSTTLVGKGDEEENHNLIDEHTKKWVIVEFNGTIDHHIFMKCNEYWKVSLD